MSIMSLYSGWAAEMKEEFETKQGKSPLGYLLRLGSVPSRH